jgi:hypothetical protein
MQINLPKMNPNFIILPKKLLRKPTLKNMILYINVPYKIERAFGQNRQNN